MDYQQHEQLCNQLLDQIGSSLRAMGFYESGTKRMVYLNDDAASSISSAQAAKLVDFFEQSVDLQQVYEEAGLGADLRCDVHCFENRIWIHLPYGPESGTIIVTEADIARNLSSFVENCRSVLE